MSVIFNFNTTILLATLTINLGLGFYILFKNRKNEVNQIFSAVLFLVAFWTTSFIVFTMVKDPEWVLFWRRITPVASGILPGYFLYFSLIFPKRREEISDYMKYVILTPGFIFALFSAFTGLMVKGFIITNLSEPFLGRPIFGPLYPIYTLYLIIFFLCALCILVYRFIKSSGIEKLQLFYVLFGMACAILSGLIVSLILPVLGFSRYFTLGPSFTLVMTAFVSYAIIRHRLLNIEDFLTRGLTVLVVAGLLIGTAYFVLRSEFNFIPPFYIISAVLFLGGLVFLRSPKSTTGQTFFLVALLQALWFFSILRYWISNSSQNAFFWAIIINSSAIFIAPLFVHFVNGFPQEEKSPSLLIKIIWYVPAFFFALLVLLGAVIKDVIFTANGYTVVPGALYLYYVLCFVLYFGFGFFLLLKKQFGFTGTKKMQVRYMLLGSFLSFAFALATNLIMPIFGNSSLTQIGPYSLVIFVAFTAYAIVKHRLMSIEIVIQRGAVYGVVTILIMTLYALAVMASEIFLRRIIGYSSIVITAGAALLIAIFYQPFVKTLQDVTDRVFFRSRYDYQKALKEVTYKIASIINLEELAKLVVSSFLDTMKVSEVSLLLLQGGRYHSFPLSLPRYQNIEIDENSPIVNWLKLSKDIAVKDEIDVEISLLQRTDEEEKLKTIHIEEVRDEMGRIEMEVWVPIVSQDQVVGIIALGQKLSGDIYTSEDLQLIGILSNQISIALENTKLYQEVLSVKNYAENILQSMTDALITTDLEGHIITFNYMAEKIMGLKAAAVFGKNIKEIWGDENPLVEMIQNTLKDHCYTNVEITIRTADRDFVPLSVSTTLLRDGLGHRQGTLLTFVDLTEVKELEGKVRRSDKLAALGTMAAGMAHEIKNPLSSMKVLSQLMPLKFEDEEFRKKFQEIMPKEINRIDRIVENLLGFARATTPKFELVDINKVIDENLEYFSEQIKSNNIKLIRESAALPEITGDTQQLSQVFSNLILNAIQAMKKGGELKVITSEGEKKEDFLEKIKVEITDTGEGIGKDNLKKLFDPFFTTKHAGTGLGLTITHSIVEAHKGSIDVKSEVNKGTTFIVTLPVTQ